MNQPAALFIFFVFVLGACSSQPATNSNSLNSNSADTNVAVNSTNDNVDELRSMIQIPFDPEEVSWRVAGNRMLAVVLFTPENYKTFSSRLNAGEGKQVQIAVERWFPAELITMSEMTGETTIGGTAYPATDFYQAPFTEGNATLIPETNYVIVELLSK